VYCLPRHPYPRLVRYTETQSLADSMGLPSRGLGYCVERLERLGRPRVPVFANIGGFSAEEIATSLFAVEPFVDGVEISLMCPNVPRAREGFDDVGLLRDILGRIHVASRPSCASLTIPLDPTGWEN
jgi:dihydroorotate dehydrogenase